MNDKFTDHDRAEKIAQKLNRIAEQTDVNSQFAAELEKRLRSAHRPKTGWLALSFKQISPALRLAAVMILLALVLSLSIQTLIPAPQPGIGSTPGAPGISTPTPSTVTEVTPTPGSQGEGYDWRGAKLYLSAPLPELPAEASVYLLQPDQRATAEEARALAQQFGIEGEVYQAPGELHATTDYMITDGRQWLFVRSKNYFTYYADYSQNISLLGAKEISDEEAGAVIDAFLASRGFNLDYRIENDYRTPGLYYVLLLTPDGHGIRFDYNMPSRWQVTIGREGQVISVDSSQIDYETVGTYGIRSAEEAFQQVLGTTDAGMTGLMESAHSGGMLNESYWERSYPENQTITIYGRVTAFAAVDPAKPAFVIINGFPITGSLPSAVSPEQLVEATGQFQTVNGARIFNVETWSPTSAQETSVMGTLQQEGDQTVLLSDLGDRYVIADVPADVPLNTVIPDEQLLVNGILADGDLTWTSIQYFPPGSNFGGGGGGGTGFYALNLSGTPVPFSSPTAQPRSGQESIQHVVKEGDTYLSIAQFYGTTQDKILEANGLSSEDMLQVGMILTIPSELAYSGTIEYVVQPNDTAASIAMNFGISVAELQKANNLTSDNIVYVGQTLFIPGQQADNPDVGRRFEKQRGTLVINIYKEADGSQREEFTFIIKNEDGFLYTLLDDVSLEALLPYHNRPLEIWGAVKYVDPNGTPVIAVERYEAPYLGLTFQLVQGTQTSIDVNGNPLVIFTTDDGKSYAQMTRDGLLGLAIVGEPGDKVYAEALLIPDETFEGYPTMRIFNMGMAVNPKSGEPGTFEITADQPYVMDAGLAPENYVAPDATIEKVELAYYLPDPRYVPPDTITSPQYIQPVWRFYGHYSNGDEFEILVQALKQEFLLPEVETFTPPG